MAAAILEPPIPTTTTSTVYSTFFFASDWDSMILGTSLA